MDDTIVSRDTIRQRGADAFDQGRGINDHHMNPGAPAIDDWQQGWRDRRATVHARKLVKFAMECPP
ncbi:hypothetical protein [Massilia sp.]|uniref:hypothetical protein n=1 Tax=Massilia sp. TaxID=1882437 RepID=UPI00352DF639